MKKIFVALGAYMLLVALSIGMVINMRWSSGLKHSVENDNRVSDSHTASYTVYKNGTTYYAEANFPGGIDYTGTDADVIIQAAIDALSNGGKIFLHEGIYEIDAALAISTDGITLEGSGNGRDQAYYDPSVTKPSTPLARLTKGTVIRQTTSSTNAFTISGKRYGIALKHLGIDFTQTTTGHGVSCTAASNDIGLSQFHFEDIFVNDNSADTYALKMESPCLGTIDHLSCFGGGLLEIVLTETTPAQFFCGNILGNDLFGYITKAMTVAPIHFHREDGLSSGQIDLMQFNRLQLNCNFDLATVRPIQLSATSWSTFVGLDIEVGADYAIDMGACSSLTFIEPLYNGDPTAQWTAYTDCRNIRVIGGYLNCIVYDRHATDSYFETWMLNVDAGNLAKLLHCKFGESHLLTNNCGKATILNGTATIAVTHGLRTTPTNIMLTGTHTECQDAYATSVGATTFTITVDGNVTANRDVYWTVSCDQ